MFVEESSANEVTPPLVQHVPKVLGLAFTTMHFEARKDSQRMVSVEFSQ
jgi:hypothetical protein